MTVAAPNLDLWPRTPEYRFRIYALRDGELDILAACPTAAGIGNALFTLHQDEKEAGRFGLPDRGAIGVLDVLPTDRSKATGEWIVSPFPKGAPPR